MRGLVECSPSSHLGTRVVGSLAGGGGTQIQNWIFTFADFYFGNRHGREKIESYLHGHDLLRHVLRARISLLQS